MTVTPSLATTPPAAWVGGYELNNGIRVTASYGTAFKAPTFNELYFPGYGNPDLEPETSRSAEVGLAGNVGEGHWSANLYRTEIDDLIAYDASIFAPNNISEARITGLELTYRQPLGAWQSYTQLTLMDPEHRGDDANKGNLLPRRAHQTLRVDLNRDYGRYNTGVTLHASGNRYDDLANTKRLSGYATLDARLQYALSDQWQLKGQLNNLFDKDYQTNEGYNQAGRTVFVTLSYAP